MRKRLFVAALVAVVFGLAIMQAPDSALANGPGSSSVSNISYSGTYGPPGGPLTFYSGVYGSSNIWDWWAQITAHKFIYHSALVELYNGAYNRPDVSYPWVRSDIYHSGSWAFSVYNANWTWFSGFVGNSSSKYWGGEAWNVNSTWYSVAGGSTITGLWGFNLCGAPGCYATPSWYYSYTNW